MQHKILIAEDDTDISRLLSRILEAQGYQALQAFSGTEALSLIEREEPDLLLLDLMLPGLSGEELLRKLREERRYSFPVLILSAKSALGDKVALLKSGADDYITKPFNPVEVSARVRSQLRRYMQLGAGSMRQEVLRCGGIELDDTEKKVLLDGEEVALTPTEYEILKLLMQHPGKVFSPKEIYQKIWNDLPYGSENTVAVHIRHIREKLEINPAEPRYLKVVWGQGYKCEKFC